MGETLEALVKRQSEGLPHETQTIRHRTCCAKVVS